MEKIISTEFPFESHFLEVQGSKMHYVDEGNGDVLLFLHGNPTSSYLWRNIIPYLTPYARCIAPDLIGMGKSDKPDIDYRFFDHYKYLLGFIKALNLKNVTLVLHDWGSGLGFHYAANHQENIRAVAFMESILRPVRWADFPSDFKMGFKMMRTPGIGWFMISVMNMFIKSILPQATLRKLTKEEMDRYKEPFPTITSRKPIRQWPCEIPIEGKPADVHEVISSYHQDLQTMECPKLLFYVKPGGLILEKTVTWCKENLKNLQTIDLGKGMHYVQEEHPHEIGQGLADWFTALNVKSGNEKTLEN